MAKNRKKERKFAEGFRQWYGEKKPVLKFAAYFLSGTLGFYLLTSGKWFDEFRAPLLKGYAAASSLLLNIFGMKTTAAGEQLYSSQFGVNIAEGCDAVAPTILFIVSILVFPISWKKKWPGIIYGLLFLFVLNIIRIISLFLTGVYASNMFELMHVEIWQTLFIIITVLSWIFWLKWATKEAKTA